MRVIARLLLLLSVLTSLPAQELVQPRFLFDYVPGELTYGMVDIATCLELHPATVTDVDAGRWVAIVTLSRQNRVPSCAQCYTHIDGANIIGVLPIIKDTLREPFLIHSSRFQNHGVPWFWTPSRPGYSSAINVMDPESTSFLSGLTTAVSQATLTSFVSGPTTKFSYPQTAAVATGGTTVDMPYTQGVTFQGATMPGTVFNGNYLTVPDTVEDLPTLLDFSPTGSVPYPAAAFLFPGGSMNLPTGAIATNKTIELQSATGRSLLQATGLTQGTLTRLSTPVLTPAQQTPESENYSRMYWPAKEYYSQASFASPEMATDLQLCGVDYQVREYGTIHPTVLAQLKVATAAWSGQSSAGSFWSTSAGLGVSDEGRADFNAVSKYWTGR